MVLLVVVFALAMQFLFVYIDELVGKGLGIGVIFEFLGWAMCTLMPMAMPLAMMLASIMTLGGLGERNELLAMKAAGVSLKRILAPVMILSAFISIGAFFIADDLVPVAYNKIYTLHEDILKTNDEIKIPTKTFYDGIEGYILRVNERDKETGKMSDLMIYDHSGRDGNTNLTLADSGYIEITPDKSNLIFTLFDGCSYTEKNSMTYRDTSLSLNRVEFDEQQMIISLENYTFSRSENDKFSDAVMSRDIKGLRHDKDSLSERFDSLVTTQIKRFRSYSALAHFYQLDSSEAVKLKRKLNADSLLTVVSGDNEFGGLNRTVSTALSKVNTDIEQINNYTLESSYSLAYMRRLDVARFRKYTLSLACLIFFFIGAPLGAIIRKGGLGTPVVISIFFYLVYYVIDIIGKKLAWNGAMTPFLGAIVSSFVLLPIGIWLTRKSTQDSSLFNMDSYKDLARMIGKKISKVYHRMINRLGKSGKLRIVYMGTPEFAVAPLDALLKEGFEVAGVVTVADKPSGRGLNVNESPVKKYALEHNLPVLQPEKLKDPDFLSQLAELKANLFVVVAFRMLPKEVWQMPVLGTFNLHASLLPQYRGAAPINWAIINNEKFTGVTTFFIDEQIDTGKIIYQESCAIESYDDAGALHDRLMEMGAKLVVKTVNSIENHDIKPYEQSLGFETELKPAPKITKELCHIDWTRDVQSISCLIRGLNPYPAAYTTLVRGDEVLKVKIFDAYDSKLDDDPSIPVGSIILDGKHLQVKCGKGILRIFSLQLAGRNRVKVDAFLRGFRDPDTYHFE